MKAISCFLALIGLIAFALSQTESAPAKATANLENLSGEWVYVTDSFIQDDLKMTAEQRAKVKKIRDDAMEAMATIAKTTRSMTEMRTLTESNAKLYFQVLTKEQRLRVREIWIQQHQSYAILVPSVQDALGMTTVQRAQAKAERKKYQDAMDDMAKAAGNSEEGLDMSDVRERQLKANKTLMEALPKILTSEQLKKLKDLGGKPLPERPKPSGG